MLTFTLKPKRCEYCHKTFMPQRPMQAMCKVICAIRAGAAEKKAKATKERAQTRARKAALKTIPDLIKEAQREFNAYIRARDAEKPCICCGKTLGSGEVGGLYDCGHYRSTGSAPHLRFHEHNAHAQRKYCNRHGAGRAVDYRIGLVNRIGLDAVEALESENAIRKWTREELIEIRKTYAAKRKAIVNEGAE